MDDIELKKLWEQYDAKLEKVLTYNRTLALEITKQKAKQKLASAKPAKYWGIVLGIPWILFLNTLVVIGYLSEAPFLTVSFGMISLFTTIALGTYIYHLIMISQINISESVVEVQKKLAKLKTSTITITRNVVLQLPFWTTWYLSWNMLQSENFLYWLINGVITSLFTFIAIWLFRNIKPENVKERWIKWLFSDSEWNAVVEAAKILDQIDDLENAGR